MKSPTGLSLLQLCGFVTHTAVAAAENHDFSLERLFVRGNQKPKSLLDSLNDIQNFGHENLPAQTEIFREAHVDNLTCSDVSDDWWQLSQGFCSCSEVNIDGNELFSLDCGYCVVCGNISRFGGEVCQRTENDSIHWKNRTLYQQESSITFIPPDGPSVVFTVTNAYSAGTSVLTSVSVNGVSCGVTAVTCEEGDEAVDGFIVDCTASPFIDDIYSDCIGFPTNATDAIAYFAVQNEFNVSRGCINIDGSVWFPRTGGDPHITTFDGVAFDCQAKSEFTLVRSENQGVNPLEELNIQGRFENAVAVDAQASVLTAIVISHKYNKLQISLDDLPMSCEARIYENSVQVAESSFLEVSDKEYILKWPGTFLEVRLLRRNSPSFGCHFTAGFILPLEGTVKYFGLYGTPDNNRTNDWVTSNGTTISLPEDPNELLYAKAYNYCVQNWCIQNAVDSLFTYPSGKSFNDFFGCDIPYNSSLEDVINNANPELVSLCGDDKGCLVDGALGDSDDAQAALEDAEVFEKFEEEFKALVEEVMFSAMPSAMPSTMPSGAPSMEATAIETELLPEACECGLQVCRVWNVLCLIRNNCRVICGCRRLFFSCE